MPSPVLDLTIHPLVLLSAADHYHRVARGTRKRVVGVLLGQVFRGKIDATNSFAVPFEEDSKNPSVFYLDHNFLENMLAMFKKINAKETVVGFYSTGPQIRPNDSRIHKVMQRYCDPCVFTIIDVRPDRPDLPVTAYVHEQGDFRHLPVQMGAAEAEEIGVEHLLRDVHDPTLQTVSAMVQSKMSGLATLADKLTECQNYLLTTDSPSPQIAENLQRILALLPHATNDALIAQTNDMHLALYLASLIRTVGALHDLLNNKLRYGLDGEEKKEETPTKEVAATTSG